MGLNVIGKGILKDSLNGSLTEFTNHESDLSAHGLGSVSTASPSIGYGMNSKINASGSVVFPKFTVQGQHYLNTFGRDGNCEDTSKWIPMNCNVALDSSNVMFGNNSIKITATNSSTIYAYSYITDQGNYKIDKTQYYMFSAYVKNGNATNIGIGKFGTGGNGKSASSTDTTKFNRIGFLVAPSDFGTNDYIDVALVGSSGQYGWVDGIQVTPITAADYAAGLSYCLNKYPYADSIGYVQNPYFENRRNNLVRNGNGEDGVAYWTSNSSFLSMSIVNNKFSLKSNSSGGGSYLEPVKVKPNTYYYLNGNTSGNTVLIVSNGMYGDVIQGGTGVFNSGNYSTLYIGMWLASANQSGTADSISLTEGITPPTSYQSCDFEAFVAETTLFSGDSITIQGDKVTGSIGWKHKTLYGKDFYWQFGSDGAAYKSLILASNNFQNAKNGVVGNSCIKYDGKVLKETTVDAGDIFVLASNNLYIDAADTDTGWTETVNPNADEVKAFMNGWKAMYWTGSRYLMWRSVIDNSIPVGAVFSSVSAQANVGVTSVTVTDGTKFAAGDYVAFCDSILGGTTVNSNGVYTISSISGNVLTLSSAIVGYNITTAFACVKCDNPSTVALLQYCKANIAPGYEGYKLHYQLINPEDITDVVCHIHGNVWALEKGDNYVYIDDGVVLSESTNPPYSSVYSTYEINSSLNTMNVAANPLKNKAEDIYNVYKNGVCDGTWLKNSSTSTNGKVRAYDNASTFDTNATYTVDYKILATIVPQVGTITMQYTQNIVQALTTITETVEQCQKKDSSLDTIVDLSMYEKVGLVAVPVPFIVVITNVWIGVPIKLTPKKCIPTLTLTGLTITCGSSSGLIDITNKLVMAGNGLSYFTSDGCAHLSMYTSDPTVVSNIKSYGLQVSFTCTADCRGRV
jgi:hypothetical protein